MSGERSYFVDAVLEEFPGRVGFQIYCFEGEDCVWEYLFPEKIDAEEFGSDFLSGKFSDGFPANMQAWLALQYP